MSAKSDRLSFRITEEQDTIINSLVCSGKFSSRSDFGVKAINLLILQETNHKSMLNLMGNILYNITIAMDHPAHRIPEHLVQELRRYIHEEEHMAGNSQ